MCCTHPRINGYEFYVTDARYIPCMQKEEEELYDLCVEKEEKTYESAPADGSWKLDDVIAKVLSKNLKELSDACPVKCDGGVSTIWATVLCCVYLELKHPSQKDEWELIAVKAELPVPSCWS